MDINKTLELGLEWAEKRMASELTKMDKEYILTGIKASLVKNCFIPNVSHSTTPNYLDNKYEVKWLINDTYQVEQNGNCVYQGSESDCNEWLKCELGYCG